MTPFEWILIFTVALMVVAFLFMPTAQQQDMRPSGLEDFQFSDNSTSRVVPIIYGTTYIKGNCMYYGNLRSTEIRVSS